MAWLSRDILFLVAAGGTRNLGFGFFNVVFAIYLSKIGYGIIAIGTIITLSSLSGVIQTLIGSVLMDRYSRKRIMMFWGVLTLFSSAAYAISSDPILVAIMSALGLIGARAGGSGAGGMGGPVMVGQVAMLADKAAAERRNVIFAINAVVLHVTGAAGALLAVLPEILQTRYGYEELASYRALFAIGAFMSVLYILSLSFYREMKPVPSESSADRACVRSTFIPEKSKEFITKMALLGAFDSFGSTLYSSLLPYWFFIVHSASVKDLGPLYAIANLVGSLTFIIGAKLADKIGNVNATVITHLPAPFLLMLLPFAPDYKTAAFIHVLRQAISRIDNPIKQSYMMAMVPREERARARGFTAVFQRLPSSFSPTIAAYMMSAISTSMPFFIGGGIQFIHDIMYYFTFRKLKPPEELAKEKIELAP